jgi:carbon storage regulator CsrA
MEKELVTEVNKEFIAKYKKTISKPLSYLMITRHEHQSFIIDGDIIITLFQPRYGQTRLGISAPADKTILRTEVINRIMKCMEQE